MRLDHIVFAAGSGGLVGTTERLGELLGEEFRRYQEENGEFTEEELAEARERIFGAEPV